MAQYGQGFYGEMRYGVLGANYGTYTSYEQITPGGFKFAGGMAIRVRYRDSKINYKPDASSTDGLGVFEMATPSQWLKVGTSYKALVNDAVMMLSYSGANAALNYSSASTLACSTVKTDKDRVETISTYTMPIQSTATTIVPSNDIYATYRITITCAIDTIINSADIFVCGVSMESRSANTSPTLATAVWTDMNTATEISCTLIPGTNTYSRILSFNASSFTGYSNFQYAITMYSSDSGVATYVDEIEVLSETAELYMPSCEYVVDVDIPTLLSAAWANFDHYTTLEWTETVPTGTVLDIRTSAGSTVNQLSAKTPAYKMGGSQARLKANATDGWFLSPKLNFDVINTLVTPNTNTTRDAILSKVNIGYTLGGTSNSTSSISYSLYINGREINMPRINAISPDVSAYKIDASGVNCQLRVQFNRGALAFSPSLDTIGLSADCIYQENVNKTGYYISAVEQLKTLINTSTMNFFAPSHPKISEVIYTVSSTESNTVFYLGATSGITRSATVKLAKNLHTDIVCYSTLPVSISYRAQKLYPGTGTIDPITNSFSTTLRFINTFGNPVLAQPNKYLYKIFNSTIAVNKVGDLWKITEGVHDTKSTYTFTVNSLGRTNYTEQTTINLPLEDNTDIAITTIFDTQIKATTWSSSEKVYQGNINILGDNEPLFLRLPILPDLNPDAFFSVANIFTLEKNADNSTNYQVAKLGPYKFKILDNSVHMVPKPGSQIAAPTTRIEITQVDLVSSLVSKTATANLIKGSSSTTPLVDRIPAASIDDVKRIQKGTTVYLRDIDWTYDDSIRAIVWIAGRAADLIKGDMYEVEYLYKPYISANITFSCDYTEKLTEKTAWSSNTLNPVNGICSHSENSTIDILSLLPKTIQYWPDIDLLDDANGSIVPGTMKYYVHSTDNEYVSCSLDKTGDSMTATMGGLKPSEDWMLKIHGGYYYLGQDECFKYNDKVSNRIDQNIPIISDCDYTTSSSGTGALVCHDIIESVALNNSFINQSLNVSTNIVPDAGFIFSPEITAKAFWTQEGVV